MSRRERVTTIRCALAGCPATRSFTYESQREYDEIYRAQKARRWKCTRHNRPEEVLRPDNQSTTQTVVASRIPSRHRDGEFLPGLYWVAEDGPVSGSDYIYGPGFRAHADDFPEGTRLVVTTQIAIPEATS